MAIYSKPRSEKKVAERLDNAGFEVYCPLQTTIRQWSDRKKKVKVPVFPSYIFVHVEEQERMEILQDPGVLNFVYWLGKPAIIKDAEIDFIKAFLSEDYLGNLETVAFEKGDHVDIIAGPFSGVKGVVEKMKKTSVTILIESLGMLLKVELRPQQLHVSPN